MPYSKPIRCGVCGKIFAVSKEEEEKVKKSLKKEKSSFDFICKFCRQMIKER